LQADKFGDILHVLAIDELAAFGEHRHALDAEAEQPLAAGRVV